MKHNGCTFMCGGRRRRQAQLDRTNLTEARADLSVLNARLTVLNGQARDLGYADAQQALDALRGYELAVAAVQP